jgi:hypothetical protein
MFFSNIEKKVMVAIAFFVATLQKNTTVHYRRLFLLKHREDKTCKKTTKNNQ